ncbi:MAG: Do family serine endopeptidase [Candidatus Hydrogenedentes bacterium]|nr:Do family serine endopeptidase [Candidatus Hydrogenedentota bacterium]
MMTKKRMMTGLLVLMAVCVGAQAQDGVTLLREIQNGFVQIHERLRPSVVNIDVQGKAETMNMTPFGPMEDLFRFFNMPEQQERRQQKIRPQGTGSGFIYDASGLIITNNHVVEEAEKIVVRLHNGNEYDAEVVGTDPETDLAVIKIQANEPLAPLTLGDSDKVKVGEFAIAIGSPRGFEGSVSFGHVSALGREGLQGLAMQGLTFQNLIQTDAAINLGNSGGPLCNIDGEVIGINTAIVFGANSIGFAIPINTAKQTVPVLIAEGKVTRGYLGVSIDDAATYTDVASLGLPDNKGAVVRQVQPDTPADKAGLKTYDVIRKVNGEEISGASDLVRKVSANAPGSTVKLEIWRERASVEVDVTLTERHVAEDRQNMGKSVLGLKVRDITPSILERLGIGKSIKGVVVVEVEPGSSAEEARLTEGDIIIEVGQQPVNDVENFFSLMKTHAEPGKSLLIRFVRGNNDPDITIIRVPEE